MLYRPSLSDVEEQKSFEGQQTNHISHRRTNLSVRRDEGPSSLAEGSRRVALGPGQEIKVHGCAAHGAAGANTS